MCCKMVELDSFGDVSLKIKDVVNEINDIELLDEADEESDVDFGGKKELIGKFWRLSSLNESIL